MTVLATIELNVDDIDALIAAKKEVMDPVADQVFREHGHLCQVVARTDHGVLLLNFWEDEEGRDRANADPRMVAARQAVLDHTGAQATYASYPVLGINPTRSSAE